MTRASTQPLLRSETLSQKDFFRLSLFIYELSGIRITNTKRTMLEARIRRRLAETGIENAADYCKFLLDSNELEREEETVRLIDAITVNKTEFFREVRHFEYLRTDILPEFAKSGPRQIKLWSAACSNGAEAYTMAIIADEFCRGHTGMQYFVLGTDLSTDVLEQAISGRYSEKEILSIPQEYRRRHLLMSKTPDRAQFRMAPHLRTNMAFARLNLVGERLPVSRDYDVIFCRNVLIYFDKQTQKAVLNRLIGHLRPGGYLILGHSESVVGMDLPIASVASTIFRQA